MKALYATSFNGYMATGPDDDMSWTGTADKQLFKLITTVAKECVISKNLSVMLPDKVLRDPNRKFIICDRNIEERNLKRCNFWYKDSILLGGPLFIKEALGEDVLDMVIECVVQDVIFANIRYEKPNLEKYGFKISYTISLDNNKLKVNVWTK